MNPRLLVPRTGFDPRRIANLAGWWDASDAATVTLNSGNVSEWRDKSGANRHLSQSTAANQPAYTTAAQNGRNGVTFTGASSHFLTYSTGMFSYAGGGAVFIACKSVTRANNNYGAFLSEGTATLGDLLGLVSGAFNTAGVRPCTDVFAPGGVRPTSTVDGSLPFVFSWRWTNWQNHKTNGGTVIGVNRADVATEAYGANPDDFTAGTPVYRVGRAGNDTTPGSYLTGAILEIVAYNRALTAAEQSALRNYLSGKWAT
jgi:hypothetical protein